MILQCYVLCEGEGREEKKDRMKNMTWKVSGIFLKGIWLWDYKATNLILKQVERLLGNISCIQLYNTGFEEKSGLSY